MKIISGLRWVFLVRNSQQFSSPNLKFSPSSATQREKRKNHFILQTFLLLYVNEKLHMKRILKENSPRAKFFLSCLLFMSWRIPRTKKYPGRKVFLAALHKSSERAQFYSLSFEGLAGSEDEIEVMSKHFSTLKQWKKEKMFSSFTTKNGKFF